MKIQPRQPRGFILTAVLLGMAAWALVLLNLNATRSHGLNERLKLYDTENQAYLSEKYAAQVAEEFVFHPNQEVTKEKDGALTVRFTAGSTLEMAWHLYIWGDKVEVIEPKNLWQMIKKQRVAWPALP